jgi:hypothetical protein
MLMKFTVSQLHCVKRRNEEETPRGYIHFPSATNNVNRIKEIAAAVR